MIRKDNPLELYTSKSLRDILKIIKIYFGTIVCGGFRGFFKIIPKKK